MMRPYIEVPKLRDFLLEESYVLGITAIPGAVTFELDLVLTPDHADYRAPAPDEQYCFRRGLLVFKGVTRLLWSNSGNPPAVDSSGEEDYGQIDSFEWDDAGALLEGGWGRMEIVSATIEVALQ
ncbi:hypothetical protein BJ980_001671 [Nocardioides daedukensis]|uniref:Uncharacterized protein n=1 Tax=Nocardioides daedukensis TaxID=634462 RepID=A0A7Y9S227_9ACTN|nr:hypothetical protein [Nocardioides daedukensis]NYG58748.1 hypothetical protein [Nocardioides daedukensis]